MELKDGVDDQQRSVTIVTLHIQVVQILFSTDVGIQVSVLVALPGVEAEILGIEDETSETSEFNLSLRLDAETATHVVVALDDVEVVTLGTAEQDAGGEYALFHLRDGAHARQREDEARAKACSLTDAVRRQVGAVFDGLSIVVVEVLIDTEFTCHILLVEDRRTPQTTHDIQSVHQRLSTTECCISLQIEEVVRCLMMLTVN